MKRLIDGKRDFSYLFFGRDKPQLMPINTAQKIFRATKKAAGIEKGLGIDTLRHCFATHLLELGDRSIHHQATHGTSIDPTTIIYLHLLPDRMVAEVRSPLDSPPAKYPG